MSDKFFNWLSNHFGNSFVRLHASQSDVRYLERRAFHIYCQILICPVFIPIMKHGYLYQKKIVTKEGHGYSSVEVSIPKNGNDITRLIP